MYSDAELAAMSIEDRNVILDTMAADYAQALRDEARSEEIQWALDLEILRHEKSAF